MGKDKKLIMVTLFVLIPSVIFFWSGASMAGYSFWHGSGITEVRDASGNIIRPGISEEEAQAISEAVEENTNGLFGSLLFFTNNTEGDQGVTIWEQGETNDGYTLLSLLRGYQPDPEGPVYNAVLVDMDGKIVNKWELTGFPVKMLPNGSVIGGKGQFNELVGVPYLVQQDWCGNEEWSWKGNVARKWQAEQNWIRPTGNNRCYDFDGDGLWDDGNYSPTNPLGCNEEVLAGDYIVSGWHHDFQRWPNPVGYFAPGIPRGHNKKYTRGHHKKYKGKTLILANYLPSKDDPAVSGISDFRLYGEVIYIVDENGNVEFEWFCFEHYDQMGFLPDAEEAIKNFRSGAFNNENATDYQHFNNVNWVGPNKWWRRGDLRFNPEYILWDARSSNITAIIATSDHPKGDWKKGDIVWKVGPNYQAPYDPEAKLGQIIGQHMAHMIPRGLPGEGNILMFDNGGGAGFGSLFTGGPVTSGFSTLRNYSRVIEFNPVTLEVVWEYAQPDPTVDYDGNGNIEGNERLFFSFFISGAQRLKNGNTLICEGATGRIFEVTPKNKVVWEFIPAFDSGGSGLEFVGAVYRAYRVPYRWVPWRLLRKGCPE